MLHSTKFLTESLIKSRSARCCLAFSIAALTSALAFNGPARADSSSLIYVINIDVMPSFTNDAGKILKEYRATALKETGAKRIELLQRLEHGNHFAMIEEWCSQGDYDAHVTTEATRNFRTKLQPMLGSPFDERVHHAFE